MSEGMASDLKSVEEKFCGTWKYERDEKFVECLKAMKFDEKNIESMTSCKPSIVIERADESNFSIELEFAPEAKHKVTFELGKEYMSKDMHTEPPTFHFKELATYKDGVLTIKAWCQLEGGIDHQTHFTRKGNELHTLLSPLEDTSIGGTRVYKLA